MKALNFIWDFDGTLFDTYPEIAKAMKKGLDNTISNNFTYQDILKNLRISIRYSLEKYTKILNLNSNELKNNFLIEYNKIDSKLQKPYLYSDKLCELIIKNNGKNFINTHREKKTLYHLLEYYDFTKYFTEIVCSQNNFKPKPNPESNIYLVNKYKLNKKNTYIIGDRELDTQSGLNANIKPIFISENTKYSKKYINDIQPKTLYFKTLKNLYYYLQD